MPPIPGGLAVITQLRPIAVLFSIPEDDLPKVRKDIHGGQELPVEAYDRTQKTKLADGTLLTFDNQIDTTTGTVRLKASFPNTDYSLFPNQFVNVKLLVDTDRGVVLIPTAAVQRSALGTFVYVIKPDNTVEVRKVDLGASEGEVSSVKDGVSRRRTRGDRGSRPAAAGQQSQGSGGERLRRERRDAEYEHSGRYSMNLSRPFITRPVATSLLMVAIMLAGGVAYQQLPVSALPEVDYPTIEVLTFYPGASPDVMASSVTAPLERQFGQVPGLNQMTSNSSFGSSEITLQFVLNLNIDVAEQEVQAAINAASTYLPLNLPSPPIYSKTNPADAPILTLALTSPKISLAQVEDLADTRLAQRISQLPGVGLVSIGGGQKPAVRIQANPTALASYGLTLEDVRSAVSLANVNEAKGNFDGSRQGYTIAANDQLLTAKEYRPLIVAYRNGAPVVLSDVAQVLDGAENVKQVAWMNTTPAVIVNIQRQPGANIISVVDRIKALLPRLAAALPDSVKVSVLTDRTTTIRASVADVQFELMLTVALVVMVIFLFLRSLAATVIPERRGAAVAGGHVRRDVPARLQP